jgi:hypothetical protein
MDPKGRPDVAFGRRDNSGRIDSSEWLRRRETQVTAVPACQARSSGRHVPVRERQKLLRRVHVSAQLRGREAAIEGALRAGTSPTSFGALREGAPTLSRRKLSRAIGEEFQLQRKTVRRRLRAWVKALGSAIDPARAIAAPIEEEEDTPAHRHNRSGWGRRTEVNCETLSSNSHNRR